MAASSSQKQPRAQDSLEGCCASCPAEHSPVAAQGLHGGGGERWSQQAFGVRWNEKCACVWESEYTQCVTKEPPGPAQLN